MSAPPPVPPPSLTPPPLPRGAAPPVLGRLGDYYLLRKLAQGGMAEIFLAKRLGMGGFEKTFVVKRMLDSLSGSREFVGMFLDEARLAARLTHQNIAQIYDFGVIDGHHYIAMEHIAGEDLRTILAKCFEKHVKVPVPIAVRIALDVSAGLEYAHGLKADGQSLDIIHRDVSPSNVMVSYQGAVKLLDFGIAKATSRVSDTTTGNVKGKFSFLSPEQIKGLPLDGRVDVFALGISLYELLTKRRPFRRDSEMATIHAILHDPLPDPREARDNIPEEVAAVVTKALARDRDERYRSAGELRSALQGVLNKIAPGTGPVDLQKFMLALFGAGAPEAKGHVPTLSGVDLASVQPLAPVAGTVAPAHVAPTAAPAAALGSALSSARGAGQGLGLASGLVSSLAPPSAPARDGPGSALTPEPVRTFADDPSRSVLIPPDRWSRWPVRRLLLVGGAALILVGAGVGVLRALGPRARPDSVAPSNEAKGQSSPAPSPSPVAAPVPAVPAPVAVAPPGTAGSPGVPAAPGTAGAPGTSAPAAPAPVPAAASSKPRPAPRPLDEKGLFAVVSRSQARFTACFKQWSAELPAEAGRITLELTVSGSGRVKGVRADLDAGRSPSLDKCLAVEARRLRFPPHTDPEVNFQVPLVYRRER